MRSYSFLPVLLAGCTFGLQPSTLEGILALGGDTAAGSADTDTDTDSDTDTDTDADGDAPVIDSIDPTWGTTVGGTEVTLLGTFGDDATVRVGGNEAELKTVQSKRGKLVFYTPEAGSEGTVNVVVESGGKTGKLVDGFTYFLDGTGLVGLLGTVTWIHQVGTYWPGATEDIGYAFIVPIVPSEFDWTLVYSQTPDTCTSDADYTYAPALTGYDAGSGSSATLTSGASAINLSWDATGGQFVNDTLGISQISGAGSYDLSELTLSNDAFPEYTLTDLAGMPGQFTVSDPAITGSTVPQVTKNFTLTWAGGAAGDGIFVELDLWNSAGTGYQETVKCHLRDDGSFNLPSSAFTLGWPTSRQIDIFVTRYKSGTAKIPYNNADTNVVGEYTVYGAAFTR